MSKTETIDLAPGQAVYWRQWLPPRQADELLAQLVREVAWQSASIMLFGQRHTLPRLQAWYGDPQAIYRYSGLRLVPHRWLPCLSDLAQQVARQTASPFNAVLANLYRDGADSNGWHSDDEPELGDDPVIASVSLGAERRFRLRNCHNRAQTVSIDLQHGSLLWMGQGVQRHWQHQLAKTRKKVGIRVNLTFRQVGRTAAHPHNA